MKKLSNQDDKNKEVSHMMALTQEQKKDLMEVKVKIKGGLHSLWFNNKGILKGCDPIVERELRFTLSHINKKLGDVWDEPYHRNEREEFTIWDVAFQLSWNNWNDELKYEGIQTFKDPIMGLSNVIIYECRNLEQKISPVWLLNHYGEVVGYDEENEIYVGDYDPYNNGDEQHLPSLVEGGECQGNWYPNYTQNYLKVLRKIVQDQDKEIKEVSSLIVDYYHPEADEVVVSKSGYVISSTKKDAMIEHIKVEVKFDRISLAGNPVYKVVKGPGKEECELLLLQQEEEYGELDYFEKGVINYTSAKEMLKLIQEGGDKIANDILRRESIINYIDDENEEWTTIQKISKERYWGNGYYLNNIQI